MSTPPEPAATPPTATLQQVIDTVGRVERLDDLIPAVLRTVARAVGTDNCCLFVAEPDETVRVRYWLRGDVVLTGEEMLVLLPGHEATTRSALDGFAAPAGLFGEPKPAAPGRPCWTHRLGTAMPAFDAWLLAYGRPYQASVPLVVNRTFHGGQSIFREGRPGDEFTPEQLHLAESMARQLALAVETHRLADTVRRQAAEAAAAERERAAAAGGELTIESGPGRGTTVAVVWPGAGGRAT